mmetsp:Transcript_17916/g.53835  ORF Transcript_17916/g.53835 Transcript_17916/m.53835 type:complete len:496 (+) Transcript_17916:1250-2737(+)
MALPAGKTSSPPVPLSPSSSLAATRPSALYTKFGSFRSESVEALIAQPDELYKPLPNPPEIPELDPETAFPPSSAFGERCSNATHLDAQASSLPTSIPSSASSAAASPTAASPSAYWLLDTTRWTYLNHGAFGAPLSALVAQAHRWRIYCERQPLRFIDRELLPRLVRSVRAGASLLSAQPAQVAILPNVTTALNSALRSLFFSPTTSWSAPYASATTSSSSSSCSTPSPTSSSPSSSVSPLGSGSAVLWLDVGYGAVNRLLRLLCARSGATPLVLSLPLPFTEQELLDRIRAAVCALDPALQLRLCVLDHVTSNTAVLLPVRRIAMLLRSLVPHCYVVVDGAHALGSVPRLDVPSLGVHVYATNCHKWFMMPRGCALLWVADQVRPCIEHVIVSHGFGAGFLSQFVWDGTRDYSTALVLPDAVRIWRRANADDAVIQHCHRLVWEAATLLSQQWSTEPLFPENMLASMCLVRVPDAAWLVFAGEKEEEEKEEEK